MTRTSGSRKLPVPALDDSFSIFQHPLRALPPYRTTRIVLREAITEYVTPDIYSAQFPLKDSHLQLAAITQSITSLIGVVNPQRVRDWLSFRYSFNSTQISHALQNQPINLLFWAEIYSFKHFLDELVGDAYDTITPTPPSHGGRRRLPPRLHILLGLLLDSFVAVLPELRATLPHHILARLSWLRAVWFLKLMQVRPATTTNHRGLLDAFHTADLHTYSLHRHLQPGTVYIKVSHKHPAWYIGSTVHTITEREVSRRSRFNQLRAGTQSFFEPALRIWHAADTYEHYLTIALHARPSESQLRSLEQDMIATYHPQLNAPFVYILLGNSAYRSRPRTT